MLRPAGRLLAAGGLTWAALGCGSVRVAEPPGGIPSGVVEAEQPAGLRPTRLARALRDKGFDPAALPDLHQMTEAQRREMMKLFARSLGVECNYCHVVENYGQPTVRKAVAEAMYREFVRGLRHKQGQAPLFCDSCHPGRPTFVDRSRSDEDAVREFMSANFVQPLERADGQEHRCRTCHGQPFNEHFLPRTVAEAPEHHHEEGEGHEPPAQALSTLASRRSPAGASTTITHPTGSPHRSGRRSPRRRRRK